MKRKTPLLLFFPAAMYWLIFTVSLFAGEERVPMEAWQEAGFPYLQNYSPMEYRENPQNWCIARDERGIMYFGNYGVLVYDGVSWEHIKTGDAVVRSLCVSGGRIYLGTQGDLGFLAPDAAGQLYFVSLLDSIPPENRDFKDVWRTFAVDDAVYFQTFKYLFRWKDKRFRIWATNDEFHLSFAVNGVFYIRKWDSGLLRMAESSGEDSLLLVPGGEMFAAERIFVMLPYDSSTILTGSFSKGLFLYDGSVFKPFPTAADAFLRENNLYCGAVLPGDLFALGTLRGGVAIIDKAGNLCRILNKSAGLRDEKIHYTFAGPGGTLWLAMDNGLARVEISSPLTRFRAASGIEGTVESMARQGGRLYAATHLGVYYLDTNTGNAGSFRNSPARRGNPAALSFPRFKAVSGITSQPWTLLAVGDHLLTATDQGVYQITDNHAALLKTGWGGAACFYRSQQDSNRVYVGLYDGLAALRLVNGRWEDLGRVENISEQVVSIAGEKNGTLWLGTQFEGVLKVELTPAAGSPDAGALAAKITRYGKEQGLPDTRISPAFIGGKIVFATQKGLRRFDPARQWFVADSTFGAAFADTSCWIFRVEEDQSGNVWFIAGTGRQTLNGRAVPQNGGAYAWQDIPFGRLNDLGDMFIIYPEKDPGGSGETVWFGGAEGIARYSQNISRDYAFDFPALIRRVIVNGDSVIFGGAAEETFERFGTFQRLKYAHNTLRFEFAAPVYDEPSANQYQFKLHGFDENWSHWTAETKKDYTGLTEGDYVFKVRAKNIYNHLSSEASFRFSILPPWYRSWWAYGGYLLLFLLGLLAIDRVQRSRLIKKEQQKARLKEAEIIRVKNTELSEKNDQLKGLLRDLNAAQAKLLRSEARFRSVAQTANDAIITADERGCITFWNERAAALFGYTEEEVLGQPLTILMPDRYRQLHDKGVNRTVAERRPRKISRMIEVHGLRKDGSEFPIELSVASWRSREGMFVTGIIRDITKRKQAQEALEKSRAQLQAEDERKSAELEKARQAQLSLLPRELPQLPHIEMDAYMKTAAEVGGDYYDAHVGPDNTLTVLVGDATGHGLNAGMMVAATKSIFETLADDPDLLKLFERLNRVLTRLNLRGLYMGLQVIRIKDYQLEICSAGMPPLLIRRAHSGKVEEVMIKAMPLGSVFEFPYRKETVALSSGDTVLLMSDGLPERFNERNELFDDDRAKAAFAEAAHLPPAQIIERLVEAGEAWANGRPQDDDITFVALKVK